MFHDNEPMAYPTPPISPNPFACNRVKDNPMTVSPCEIYSVDALSMAKLRAISEKYAIAEKLKNNALRNEEDNMDIKNTTYYTLNRKHSLPILDSSRNFNRGIKRPRTCSEGMAVKSVIPINQVVHESALPSPFASSFASMNSITPTIVTDPIEFSTLEKETTSTSCSASSLVNSSNNNNNSNNTNNNNNSMTSTPLDEEPPSPITISSRTLVHDTGSDSDVSNVDDDEASTPNTKKRKSSIPSSSPPPSNPYSSQEESDTPRVVRRRGSELEDEEDRPFRCSYDGCDKAYKNPGGLKVSSNFSLFFF